MDIKLTADWIVTNMTSTDYCDGDGNVTLCCDSVDYTWLMLAFTQMDIDFDIDEYIDEYDEYVFVFEFKLEDIEQYCPNKYKSLYELNEVNKEFNKEFNKNKLPANYIYTNGTTLSFEECEKLIGDRLSVKNLAIIASHLCVDEKANKIKGFYEDENGVIHLNYGDKIVELKKEGK